MRTAGCLGASYGSEIPVNSLMIPARRLGVESFTVPLLADLEGSGDVDENVSPQGGNHLTILFSDRAIRRDRGTDRDPTRLCDLRRHVPDAPDVQIPVFFAEAQLRREVLAHEVAIQKGDGPASHLQKLDPEDVGDRRLSRPREPGEENRESLPVPGWMALT